MDAKQSEEAYHGARCTCSEGKALMHFLINLRAKRIGSARCLASTRSVCLARVSGACLMLQVQCLRYNKMDDRPYIGNDNKVHTQN